MTFTAVSFVRAEGGCFKTSTCHIMIFQLRVLTKMGASFLVRMDRNIREVGQNSGFNSRPGSASVG